MSVASSWSVFNGIRIVLPGPIATLAIGAMTPHARALERGAARVGPRCLREDPAGDRYEHEKSPAPA
jgi:hypothetical protein